MGLKKKSMKFKLMTKSTTIKKKFKLMKTSKQAN